MEASRDLWYKSNDFFLYKPKVSEKLQFSVVVSTNSTMEVGSAEEVPVWQDKFHFWFVCNKRCNE